MSSGPQEKMKEVEQIGAGQITGETPPKTYLVNYHCTERRLNNWV